MGAIQVKNVPEELHAALRRRAAHEGMDLQAYLLRLIRRDLSVPSQREWLEQLHRQPKTRGLPPADEVLHSVREERGIEHSNHGDRR